MIIEFDAVPSLSFCSARSTARAISWSSLASGVAARRVFLPGRFVSLSFKNFHPTFSIVLLIKPRALTRSYKVLILIKEKTGAFHILYRTLAEL